MAGFYRVVRVRPNGTEQILRDVQFTDFNDEQLQRAEAFADGRSRVPSGQRIRLYSSDENGVVLPEDMIWDSDVQP